MNSIYSFTSIMPIYSRFPMEITVKIAHILYTQECFVELESLIYVFPKLTELFSYKVPTVVLIDDDQYEKFSSFLYSRERPFGSQDLFIIRQRGTFESDEKARSESRCYMVLKSKCYQDLIPVTLKYFFKEYVTLVEKNSTMTNASFKFYELVWIDPASVDPEERFRLPELYRKHIRFPYADHVGILLQCFLTHIKPRLLRFEAYSSKDDICFEWEQLYSIYSSFICASHPTDCDVFYGFLFRTDSKMNMPKCCFEFIKDINHLPSLYQHSSALNSCTLESKSSDFSVYRWLKRKLTKSADDESTTAFFHNVKNITVDKVSSNTSIDISSSNNFISVNCSRSATPESSAYKFVQNHYSVLVKTGASVALKLSEAPSSDHFFPTRAVFDNCVQRPSYNNYIDLFHLDFSIEKLQSADITATYMLTVQNLAAFENSTEETKNYCSDYVLPKLKDLELRLNKLVHSSQGLRQSRERFFQKQIHPKLVSQQIMESILQEVTAGVENECLSKEQPLKLRVFQNDIQRLNLPTKTEYVESWFPLNCRDPRAHYRIT